MKSKYPFRQVKKRSKLLMRKGSHAAAPIKGHGESEAEKILLLGLEKLGLVDDLGRLIPTRKGDPRKVALASLIRAHTCVGNEWLAQRLEHGPQSLGESPHPPGKWQQKNQKVMLRNHENVTMRGLTRMALT